MAESKFKVAVGLPVYNGEKYIRPAIDSILNQSYGDFEVVISDNASSDGTGDICMEYARRDSRIRYIRQQKNIGAPRNFNMVFQQSRGEYFKWASANDICRPTMIEKCITVLDENPDVGLCYPRTLLIDKEGSEIGQYDDRLDLQNNDAVIRFRDLLLNIRLNNAQSGLIRTEILKKTSLEGTFRGADICLLAELVLLGKFYEWPEYLFLRRIDPEASTLGQSKAYLQKFYNPGANGQGHFTFTRINAGMISVVNKSSVPWKQKLRLYMLLAHKFFWDRGKMGAEIWGRCKELFKSGKKSSP